MTKLALKLLGWVKALPPWLALVLAVAVWGWLGHRQADKWRHTATRYASALQAADSASKAELARATAERDAAIKHEKETNDAIDQRVALARAGDAGRLADYKRRLRAAASARGGGSLPAATQADVAQSGERSDITTQLDDDLGRCTVIARRLMEIHAEAVGE